MTELGNAREDAPTLQAALFVLLVLTILAVSTRVLPLSISALPYNQDGLTECRIATDLQKTGHLGFLDNMYYSENHSSATPVYDLLLAFSSSFLGSSPLYTAQFVVACVSVLTVVGGYLLALIIIGRRSDAFAAGLFMGLFGTLVFLTGSTWKGSLGFALLVLLFFAYVKRANARMFVLEIIVLALFPLVHHLAALVAYMSIGYLTVWTILVAAIDHNFRKRHFLDALILVIFSCVALAYYRAVSFNRLKDLTSETGLLSIFLAVLMVGVAYAIVLSKRSHFKMTFAPVPALIGFGLFVLDHFHPIFPYSPGSANYTIVLAASTCLLLSIAWLGLEVVIESKSKYRAVPLAMLLPVFTLFLFGVISGMDLSSHQIFYRSFDFADLALGMGVAAAVYCVRNRPRARFILILGLISSLLVTFPFAYATGVLVGVRHDTQAYEVDALDWVSKSFGTSTILQSDERISYIAMALYDYEKMAYLPERLVRGDILGAGVPYLIEDEWMTVGVNDYPRGHPIVNSTWVSLVLESSNVWYSGGPSSNNIVVFSETVWGMDQVFGQH